MNNFNLSEINHSILDSRLQKLTYLEMDKIKAEHQEIIGKIKHLNEILST